MKTSTDGTCKFLTTEKEVILSDSIDNKKEFIKEVKEYMEHHIKDIIQRNDHFDNEEIDIFLENILMLRSNFTSMDNLKTLIGHYGYELIIINETIKHVGEEQRNVLTLNGEELVQGSNLQSVKEVFIRYLIKNKMKREEDKIFLIDEFFKDFDSEEQIKESLINICIYARDNFSDCNHLDKYRLEIRKTIKI